MSIRALVPCTLIALMTVSAVYADAISFSLVPSPNINGAPGQTIGWGFSVTNQSALDYYQPTNLNADSFSHATATLLFDILTLDLAPGQTAIEFFNSVTETGLYELTWDTDAPLGFTNNGSFVLSGAFFQGNPNNGGTFDTFAPDASAQYSATVGVTSTVPEPSSLQLFLSCLVLLASLRLLRSVRGRLTLRRWGRALLAGCVVLALSSVASAQLVPGDILISNHTGSNVQLLRPSTGTVSTLVSVSGTPIGVAFDTTGILYINVGNGIMRYDPHTNSLTNFFTGNGQREGLAFDRDSGHLFSVSFGSNLIEVVDLQGHLLQTITIAGTSALLGVNARAGQLAVTDANTGNVYIGPTSGTSFKLIGNVAAGNTYAPAIDIAGNVFVNDFLHGQTVQFTPAPGGVYSKSIFINGLNQPANGLSIGPDGSFTISEYGANAVSIWNNNGTFRTRFPGVQSPDELVVYNPPCATAGGDTDGDGLCDDWERNGLTVMVNGAPVFVNLPAMGADPMHKDIFVQTDYMTNAGLCLPLLGCLLGHSHRPKIDSVTIVTQAFANAPVANPDGTTGIHLHVDCGSDCVMNPVTGQTWGALSQANSLPHMDTLGTNAGGYDWTSFAQIKAQKFSPARIPAFHYLIYAHNLGGLDGTSGISRGIVASDFIVSLGSWNDQVGTTLQQAGTLMHELGHNLSLQHGGGDSINNKPNYLSVMNYSFQMSGVIVNTTGRRFDYSPFQLPNLDENSLNENVGLNGGAAASNYGTQYFCSGAGTSTFVANGNGPIDWNCNLSNTEVSVATDTNKDGIRTALTSFNDWSHLVFNGGALGELGSASNLPTITQVQQEVNPAIDAQITKPLSVSVTGSGAPQVLAGASVTLSFSVANHGTNPDTYILTPSATANWGDFSQVPGSISLAPGASMQVSIPVRVPNSTPAGTQVRFSLKATSQTGQAVTDTAEVLLAVVAAGRPTIVGSIVGQSKSNGVLTATLQLTNGGVSPGLNLSVNSVSIRTTAGTGTVTVSGTAFPLSLGNIAAGGSSTITLAFTVPSSVISFAIIESGTVQDLSGIPYTYSIGQTLRP